MIYSRFGSKTTIVRPATIGDVETLDNRKSDSHDQKRIECGMLAVGFFTYDDGKADSKERLLECAFLRADNGILEIDIARREAGFPASTLPKPACDTCGRFDKEDYTIGCDGCLEHEHS